MGGTITRISILHTGPRNGGTSFPLKTLIPNGPRIRESYKSVGFPRKWSVASGFNSRWYYNTRSRTYSTLPYVSFISIVSVTIFSMLINIQSLL